MTRLICRNLRGAAVLKMAGRFNAGLLAASAYLILRSGYPLFRVFAC
jgi:hypothetical protein